MDNNGVLPSMHRASPGHILSYICSKCSYGLKTCSMQLNVDPVPTSAIECQVGGRVLKLSKAPWPSYGCLNIANDF